MKRLPFFLLSLLPLLLTACPPGQQPTIRTITLNPTQTDGTNWSQQHAYSQSWECDVPWPPGAGFFLNGLGPEPVPGGEIDVGYEDIFNQGAQPFPCEQEQEMLYRGHVMFDFSMFDAIGSATLQFNVAQSENATAGPSEIPANSYATVLGMSTGLINGDNGPYYWPYDSDVTLPACIGGIIKPDCQLDVSSQARQWASGAHANYGFIFAGPILNLPGNLPQDNNAQLSWYANFQVQVVYNPAMNPRAPQ